MTEPKDDGFHIPVDQIAKEVPFPLKGVAKDKLEDLDNADLNKDGKRDVAQIANLFYVLQPLVDKVNQAVDFEELADWLVEQKFVKDKALLKAAILQAASQIEKAESK